MATQFYLSIDIDMRRHPKVIRFCRLMGTSLARDYLVELWSFAAEHAKDGDLSAMDPLDIEISAGHSAADGRCYAALVAAGFVDEERSGDVVGARRIHNWMKPGRTGYALLKRGEELERWKRDKRGKRGDVSGKSKGHPGEDTERLRGNPAEATPLHGSRFSPEDSPSARDPGTSTTDNDPDAVRPDGSASPEEIFTNSIARNRGRLTGQILATVFGLVREDEIPGCLAWVTARGPGNADSMAATIGADRDSVVDVVPSMRRMFAKAKAGEVTKAGEILADASFAFGHWCATFTRLREEIRGVSPAAPTPIRSATPRVKTEAEISFEKLNAERSARPYVGKT